VKRQFIFYPLAFAIWIVLGAYVPHLEFGEVQIEDISRALFLIPASALLSWFFLGLVLRNWTLGALFVWVSLLLLFTYKAQSEFVWEHLPMVRNSYIGFIPLLLWLSACLAVYRLKDCSEQATKILNITGGCLLVIPVFGMFPYSSDALSTSYDLTHVSPTQQLLLDNVSQDESHVSFPNIVYIILDGYARNDVLQERYDFDNSKFLADLTNSGFYVAEQSRANYAQTTLSLASSLNFQYLDDISTQWGKETSNRRPLRDLIHQNKLVEMLKGFGYKTIAFSSGISFTELRETDSYIVPAGTLNEWESFFLLQSPIPQVMKTVFGHSLYDVHKTRLQYLFENLPKVKKTPQPQFIFAHFVTPHPPFVLGHQDVKWQHENSFSFRDGSEYRYYYHVSSEEYRARYIEQLKALNQYMKTALLKILSEAERPTIIILQSDHGPGADLDWEDVEKTSLKERMSILNAYHIPNDEPIGLYPDVTPVNTFRIILNHYFDEDLPLLPDESYFSTMDRPYDFLKVTEKM